jgi:outer membrane lipoprotein-sorting protein
MTKRIITGLAMLLLVALVVSTGIWAAGPEFSADMTMTDAKGKVATGKIFMKPQKIRQEIITEGQTSVTILRMDKKVSWTLMPENQYMEVAIPFDTQHPEESGIEYEMTEIGNETINGYDCKVVQYTYKEKKYGVVTQWISKKLTFAIKTVSKDAKGKVLSTIEYSNIKSGPQPDSLFEIPAGYKKFGLNFKLPGM